MDNELRQKIERLEAQVEALTNERIPKVDRASKLRDKRQVLAGFGLFAVAIMIAGTMSASALSGSNTVLSDDIKDTEVHGSDINANAVSSAKVKDDSLTGADIKESTLGTVPQASRVATGAITSSSFGTISSRPSATVSVPAGQSRNGVASCQSGELALSGKIIWTNIDDSSDVQVVHMGPSAGRVGWFARGRNGTTATETFTVFAECLAP